MIKFVLFMAFLLLMGNAFSQYQVFVWDNFDDGKVPPTLEYSHEASADTVGIYDFTSQGTPPAVLEGIAKTECGRCGLKFASSPKARVLSIVDSLTLDRDLLGNNGRALYQADFFLPEPGQPFPSMSVFAVDHEIDQVVKRWNWYRFGIDGTNVFYAYNNGYVKKGAPVAYLHQKLDTLNLKRPGWHRFQIIFEGNLKIICAIDGQVLSFCPIEEGTLRNLRAGIIVVPPQNTQGECFADNLSVQWTPEDVPLPDSPWVEPISRGADREDSGNPLLMKTPATVTQQNVWFENPDEAWQKSHAEKKPLLILFYAPRVKIYQEIVPILEADPQALKLLSQFNLLKVEVNQLRGGKIAETFKVNKVPTFVVLEPVEGKEIVKTVMLSGTPWASVAPILQGAVKP
jgi:hypothetical protein